MSGNTTKHLVPFLDRLSTKITIIAIVFLFVLSMAVAFLVESGFRRNQYGSYSNSQQVLKEQIKNQTMQLTIQQARLLEMRLQNISQTVQNAARFIEVQLVYNSSDLPDRNMVNGYFQALRQQNPNASGLIFVRSDGSLFSSGNNVLTTEEQDWIKNSNQTFSGTSNPSSQAVVWQHLLFGETKQQNILIQVPVYSKGRYQGFTAVTLPVAFLAEQIDQFKTFSGQYIFLIDPQGEMISMIPGTTDMTGPLNEILVRLPSTEAASQTVDLSGKEMFLVSVPLNEPSWRLALATPMEAIDRQSIQTANTIWANAETTIRSTLIMVFVLFLTGLLGALIVLDRLLAPRIDQLIQGVQSITAGDMTAAVPDTGQDELGILGKVFNQMVFEIQQRTNKLIQSEESYRSLAHSLEARVSASTREIQQLYDQTSARSQELEVLYQADEQLYRHLRLDGVLQALANVVVDQLKADKTSVLIWDEERQSLTIRGARGFSDEAISRLNDYQPGDGIAGKVFQSGQLMAVEDTATAPLPANQISQLEGIRSVLSVPIIVNGQVIGVFGMNYLQPRNFTPADIRLCQSLAQRAAIAIENARLYERAEQAATFEERQRLARELHDAITQSLYSLVLLAEAGRRHAVAGNTDQVAHHLLRLGETAQQALQEMRLLVYELRPSALAKEGLVGALHQRLSSVEKRSGIQARLFVEGDLSIPPGVEEQLYRIVQEALNNAMKHARARNVSVFLRSRAQQIQVEVRDDGRGFDSHESNLGGIGLSSMRERAARLGGELSIESLPGSGTVISVRIPIPVQHNSHTQTRPTNQDVEREVIE